MGGLFFCFYFVNVVGFGEYMFGVLLLRCCMVLVGWHPRRDVASCYWSVDVSLEKSSGRLNHWLFSTTSRSMDVVGLHVREHPKWDAICYLFSGCKS